MYSFILLIYYLSTNYYIV